MSITSRRVKIVATLGPSTNTSQSIMQLLEEGVDMVRLNFSHGTRQEHADMYQMVRHAASELKRHVAILQDLAGPKMRTTGLKYDEAVELVPGTDLTIGEGGVISITYPDLHRSVVPGSRILLDDGRMEVRVLAVEGRLVRCTVVKGGKLGANKGVNLPGVSLDIVGFTRKDRDDLEFGLKLGVDWVAMSFVRRPDDVKPLREMFRRHGVHVPALAKIERPEALHNLNGILRVFDGIMVARGDLGVELSPEEVPVWQKTLIRRARQAGKASVVATQMLESMMDNPRPTRAEASDVANAVLDGVDAVMLSGETAVGAYPFEAVSTMKRIIEKAETVFPPHQTPDNAGTSGASAVAYAACVLARDPRCRALVVLTRSGMSARLVSTTRPPIPVIAFTAKPALARQLALRWGIIPMVMDFPPNTEDAIALVEKALIDRGIAQAGDDVIIVGSTPFTVKGPTNFLKVHRVKAAS